jgi:hypothetical protein
MTKPAGTIKRWRTGQEKTNERLKTYMLLISIRQECPEN